MTLLLIKITPEVLERAKMCGTKEQPGFRTKNCAMAVAIRDIFPDAAVTNKIRLGIPDYYGFIELPPLALHFIDQFDQLVDTPHLRPLMPPFSFTVKLPDEVVERIDISDIERSQTLEIVNV